MRTKEIILIVVTSLLMYGDLCARPAPSGKLQYFYVGTYTKAESKGIYIYSIDPVTGKLSNLGLAAKSENPSFLTLTPDGRFLLAANEIQDEKHGNMGSIESFSTGSKDHLLSSINKVWSGGADPCFVSVNSSGNVLAANYSGGNVALFHLDKSGKLSEFTDLKQHHGSGPNLARQKEPHVHSAYFEPLSNRIFVSDLGTDKVAIYLNEAGKGKLKPAEIPAINIAPGSGPRHLAFHPRLKVVYVINEILNNITVVNLNTNGSFTTIETVSTLPAGYTKESNCADIHITKDGRFLYASNRGFNSIAIFSVDPVNGKIVLIGQESIRGETPRNFTLSPNEDFLLVANQNSQDIVSFRRNSITGLLEFTDQIKAFKPVCLLFCK